MSIQQDKIRELVERRANARLGGGQKRIDASPRVSYDALVKAKVDPQQKVAQILSFCGGDKELDYKSRVEVDIDGGQSQDIRLLVGGMAQREIQQD